MKKTFFITLLGMMICCIPLRAELIITTLDAQVSAIQVSSVDSITFQDSIMYVHVHEQQTPLTMPITNISCLRLIEDLPSSLQTLPATNTEVRIYDLSGRCVRTTSLTSDAVVSLKGLPAGTYIIQSPTNAIKLQK